MLHAVVAANASSNSNHQPFFHGRLRLSDARVNGALCIFWFAWLVGLVLACQQIYQGSVCTHTTSMDVNNGTIVNPNPPPVCTFNHFDVNTGFPDVHLFSTLSPKERVDVVETPKTSNNTKSTQDERIIWTQLEIQGGWPKFNSLVHLTVAIGALCISGIIYKRAATFALTGWCLISMGYLIATIVDVLAISAWTNVCSEDPGMTSRHVLARVVEEDVAGLPSTEILNEGVCHGGLYIFVTMMMFFCFLSAGVSSVIIWLSEAMDDDDREDLDDMMLDELNELLEKDESSEAQYTALAI